MTWIYVVGAAIAALGATSLLYERWMSRVTLSWPVTEAVLDSYKVEKSGRRFAVRLGYSYFVGGSLYGGTYNKYFGNKADADHLLQSLFGLRILVRYDARQPARSYFDPYRDIRVGDVPKR